MDSMHHAFDLDYIYTVSGPIVIATNPFRALRVFTLYEAGSTIICGKNEHLRQSLSLARMEQGTQRQRCMS